MKILEIFGYITGATIFIFAFLFLYWMFYPYKTIEILEVRNVTETVKAGDNFIYEVDFCKYVDSPSIVSKRFIDGVVYDIHPIIAKNAVGCQTTRVALEVPASFSGKYYLEGNIQQDFNPLSKFRKDLIVTFRTEYFYITNNCINGCSK